MNGQAAERLAEIVEQALELPTVERQKFVAAACGEDVDLRREVESLLAHQNRARDFIERPALAEAPEFIADAGGELKPGENLDDYKIISLIGEGGMSEVYLAEDTKLRRKVAIKLLKYGLGTASFIRHFQQEEWILAGLVHPNIAQLYGGARTAKGLPYFVMEYVDGLRLDDYCRERQLSVLQRLELFRKIAAAVSYAHQRLIIHRDIKPANIRVTSGDEPKLLDFGIAKLLDPERSIAGEQTVTFAGAMTPDYASPEQVRGETLTTASDVYSLGVVLYELLTGQRPYRIKTRSPGEIARVITEQEPLRPSTAIARSEGSSKFEIRNSKLLKGDLDNIVLKAMRKEPQRRYASVEQLSDDIDQYLGDRPVSARKDTFSYRAVKFINRNKVAVTAAALVVLAVITGLIVALWQAENARKQRDLARLEQAKAKRINAFLQEMIGYSGATTPGSPTRAKGRDATVIDMLDDAAQRVESELADQPAVKAEMLSTIGTTYLVLAKYDKAKQYLREAYPATLKLYGPAGLETATVMYRLANLSYLTGDYAAAESWIQKALPVYRTEATKAGFESWQLVSILSDAAFIMRSRGRLDDAEALWRECLSDAPQLDAKHRASADNPKSYLAQLYMDRGDIKQADAMASEATKSLRAQGNPFGLAQSLIDLGNVRRLQHRDSEAESLIDEGTKLFAKSQGEGHPNVAFGLTSLAAVYYDEGRYDLAEQNARKALAIAEKSSKTSHAYARVSGVLGRILSATGRAREGEPMLREAIAVLESRVPRRSNPMATMLGNLGECLVAQGRYAEAEPLLKESYQTLAAVYVPKSTALDEARQRLVSLYEAWGKPQEAAVYRTTNISATTRK